MVTNLGKVGIANKGEFAMDKTYNQCDFVYHKGSTWLALKNDLIGIEPIEGENWKYLARGFEAELLNMITATDTLGLLGEAGQKTNAQSLLDVIADKVATKLIEKGMIANNLATDNAEMVLSAPMGKYLQEQITEQNNNLGTNNKYIYSDNIDDAVKNVYPNISNRSVYDFVWNPETSIGTPLTGGGASRIIGFLNNQNYESQLMLSAAKGKQILGIRCKVNGIWNDWEKVVLSSNSHPFVLFKEIRKTVGNISANSSQAILFDVPIESGYVPSIAFYKGNSVSTLVFSAEPVCLIGGAYTAEFSIRNTATTSIGSVSVTAIVMYIRIVQ